MDIDTNGAIDLEEFIIFVFSRTQKLPTPRFNALMKQLIQIAVPDINEGRVDKILKKNVPVEGSSSLAVNEPGISNPDSLAKKKKEAPSSLMEGYEKEQKQKRRGSIGKYR